MKTSKLLIERVMTRQYWEKRHARDKYRLEQGFSKYLNGSSVSREVPLLLLYQIIKLNLLKRQDLTERNAGGCQQKYTISPRKIFSQKCMSCCQIFRSLFHQMPFYGHDIYPFFRKKCDHKMVAVEPSLHRCDYCCHKTFQALSSLQFSTLGGVTKQLRARRIHAGTPPSETNLHFQSFSGYVLSVCLSLPNRLEYNLFRDQN